MTTPIFDELLVELSVDLSAEGWPDTPDEAATEDDGK